jgi:hypothetical protein
VPETVPAAPNAHTDRHHPRAYGAPRIMTPCTAVLPAYREPRTGSVLRARRGRTEQRRDGTDRPLSRPCEVGRRGRAGRPEWGTLYASGGVRQPSASEPSRNTRPVRCPVMGRHAGHQRRDGEQTKQSVSARAAGIATPATPPLLKTAAADGQPQWRHLLACSPPPSSRTATSKRSAPNST